MSLARLKRLTLQFKRHQKGAVFLIMIAIITVGVIATLIGALSKVGLQNARNLSSSDILAQSKETVIGYMLSGGTNPPGWMMSPDVLNVPSTSEILYNSTTYGGNYDGESDAGCFDSTQPSATPPYTPLRSNISERRCLGRLPWKSLGMSINSPTENDPIGYMPWYAFSRNLNSSAAINSELLNTNSNWLKVYDMNGGLLSDRVAFVIIVPGPALPNQNRPPSPNLKGASEYLDSISLPAGCAPSGMPCTITYSNYDLAEKFVTGDEHRWMADPDNPAKQIQDPTYQFNDKLMYVTIDELMPLIEKRIAREVKACLDEYAAAPVPSNGNQPSNKYPWPAPVSDTTNYTGVVGTLFGRIPAGPNVNTSSGSVYITDFTNALDTLQTSLNAWAANRNSKSLTKALNKAGKTLEKLAESIADKQPTTPPVDSSVTDPLIDAGNYAKNIDKGDSSSRVTNLQALINTANSTLPSTASTSDSTMLTNWTDACGDLFGSSYWADWQNLVFYQVADGFKPSQTAPSCGSSCLSISGSGNTNNGNGLYRAAVIVAGKMKAGQTTRTPTNHADYLEAGNQISKTPDTSPTKVLETYKVIDPNYSTVNDLVLCLDGKGVNSNSSCQ